MSRVVLNIGPYEIAADFEIPFDTAPTAGSMGRMKGMLGGAVLDELMMQVKQQAFDDIVERLVEFPNDQDLIDQLEEVRLQIDALNGLIPSALEMTIFFSMQTSAHNAWPEIESTLTEFEVPTSEFHSILSAAVQTASLNYINNFSSGDLAMAVEGELIARGYADEEANYLGQHGELPGTLCEIDTVCDVPPVIIDLNGDGLNLDVTAPIFMNLGFGDFDSPIAAPGDGDAFLVFDLGEDQAVGSPDGLINQTHELVFTAWDTFSETDLAALLNAVDENGDKIFDTNSDGKLNSADTSWSSFGLWSDQNGDGHWASYELASLGSEGITEIDLTYTDGSLPGSSTSIEVVHGGGIVGQANFSDSSGTVVGGVYDMYLQTVMAGAAITEIDIGFMIEQTGAPTSRAWSSYSSTLTAYNDAIHNANLFFGDSGDDLFDVSSDTDGVTAYLGAGSNRFTGGSGNDLVYANLSDVMASGSVVGGQGYDYLYIREGSAAAVTIDADAIGFEAILAGDLSTTIQSGSSNIDNMFFGSDQNDTLWGGGGLDQLFGSEGTDKLYGGSGDDILEGGAGADFLNGGTGADYLAGGLGNDFYVVDDVNDEIATEIGYSLGGGIDTIRSFISYTLPSNIEILRLGNTSDNFVASGTGNYAPNTIVGNGAANEIDGSGGNDQLNGNAGNDRLVGGIGRDTLVGGSGSDTFVYNAASETGSGALLRDTINGFTRNSDQIDLSSMDANTVNGGGDDEFRFIGSGSFGGTGSGSAGELRQIRLVSSNSVIVEGDLDGDGSSDFQMHILGTSWMTTTDFIL